MTMYYTIGFIVLKLMKKINSHLEALTQLGQNRGSVVCAKLYEK